MVGIAMKHYTSHAVKRSIQAASAADAASHVASVIAARYYGDKQQHTLQKVWSNDDASVTEWTVDAFSTQMRGSSIRSYFTINAA